MYCTVQYMKDEVKKERPRETRKDLVVHQSKEQRTSRRVPPRIKGYTNRHTHSLPNSSDNKLFVGEELQQSQETRRA